VKAEPPAKPAPALAEPAAAKEMPPAAAAAPPAQGDTGLRFVVAPAAKEAQAAVAVAPAAKETAKENAGRGRCPGAAGRCRRALRRRRRPLPNPKLLPSLRPRPFPTRVAAR